MIRLYRRAVRQLLADVARTLTPRHLADRPTDAVRLDLYGMGPGLVPGYFPVRADEYPTYARHRADRP